jgi:hypothetical protein
MNLLEQQLKEFRKTRNLEKFVPLFSTQDKVDELIAYLLEPNEIKSIEYGSWLCTHLVKNSAHLFAPHIKVLLHHLESQENETILRNFLKTIVDSKPSEEHDEALLNLTLNFFENSNHKVALHVYCVLAFIPILSRNKELIPEIKLLLELKTQDCSPALASAHRHFKKIINRI